MKCINFKLLFIILISIFSIFQSANLQAYGNTSYSNISYNIEPKENANPIEPNKLLKHKKEAKVQQQKIKKSEPKPNTSEWILFYTLHIFLKVYSWIFIATTFVLWILLEAGAYGFTSLLGWLFVILGALYSGSVLLGVLDALKFTKWALYEMKWNRIENKEMYYGHYINTAFILFLCTSYFIAFPILLFVINWSMAAEIILIFALAIAALVLYIIMLSKAKKIMQNESSSSIENNTIPQQPNTEKETEEYFQD